MNGGSLFSLVTMKQYLILTNLIRTHSQPKTNGSLSQKYHFECCLNKWFTTTGMKYFKESLDGTIRTHKPTIILFFVDPMK